MAHELKHKDSNSTVKDFFVDLEMGQTDLWLLFTFMLNHPKSLLQFFPIYKTKTRGWSYDTSLIIFYLLIAIFLITIIYISVKFV